LEVPVPTNLRNPVVVINLDKATFLHLQVYLHLGNRTHHADLDNQVAVHLDPVATMDADLDNQVVVHLDPVVIMDADLDNNVVLPAQPQIHPVPQLQDHTSPVVMVALQDAVHLVTVVVHLAMVATILVATNQVETLARLRTLDHLNLENLEALAHLENLEAMAHLENLEAMAHLENLEALAHLENLEASAAHRQTLDHLNLDKVEAMDQGALVLRLDNKE